MNYQLTVQKREPGNADLLRGAGNLPGIVYGPDRDATSISMPYQSFVKLYNEAGESSLIDLTIEGESEPVIVLVQDLQFDPVKDTITHADFKQIKMGEEMEANITLNFIGESQAVKEGGTLMTDRDSIAIKCLPKDLVSSIDVDLSVLAEFEQSIHAGDLTLPAGISLAGDADVLIAKVAAPLSEEQLAAMEEDQSGSVDDVEVEGEKKEEEGEEGEAQEEKKEEPAAEEKSE